MDTQKLILHTRFAPNGTVVEISERPEGLTPQAWFNFLSDKAGDVYQTLAGGRGVFRLTREELTALRQAATPAA
ncbi:hypothetical protein ACSHT2_12030 [Bradyrhizobium sp. PUT101]|jgi:hypothetical protein|uniref:hypothetical protein n=1 Tax=unclassified Bradyrhizobium TaxID=2631580 RepID=UPI00076A1C3E|nr:MULTISPECIES: hypothetical protein [unclassified Bradyrhizobium]QOZ08231.1 hypothetical protein XH96_12340 [Bradyrhizobium sp. CCBAU 51765]ULK99538.1 hypothetical protein FJV43_07310 [Bradyrhizobium sp. I71]